MQLNDLSPAPVYGDWGFTYPECPRIYASPEDFLTEYRPFLSVDLGHHGVLRESTYRELMQLIDPDFLLQGERAAELQGVYVDVIPRDWCGGRQSAFDPEDTMNFLVPSADKSENGIDYLNLIKFDDWDKIGSDTSLSYRERSLGMIWTSNVRLWCSCPSFLFWGYQNILTQLDASIYPELRRPIIRNWGTTSYGPPQERGVCCKHLNRVLHNLGFHWQDIGRELRDQFGATAVTT